MRYYIEHDPLMRPGALCIPPHLHGAIFEPSIDAEVPPSFLGGKTTAPVQDTAASTSSRSSSCKTLPTASTITMMCADRPTPADRRLMSPQSAPMSRSSSDCPPPVPPKTPGKSRLEPRSAYAEHTVVRIPPFTESLHGRLEPRSAYAEHTVVRLPPFNELANGRLEPRSAYAEHTTVSIPEYIERTANSAQASGEKGWIEKDGLPIPTAYSYKGKGKSWTSRRALIALLCVLAVPLTYFALGGKVQLLDAITNPAASATSLAQSVLHLETTSLIEATEDTPAVSTTASAVPPLDRQWWERCTNLLVVPPNTYATRLDKLAAALDGGAWVGEPGPSVEYFLGAFGKGVWKPSERPFLVAVKGDKITLLTPAFEQSRAQLLAIPEDVKSRVTWVAWAESESPYAALLDILSADTSIVLDGAVRNFISVGIHDAQAKHGTASSPASKVSAAVASIREIKDTREVGLLRCANEATLYAIRKTREQMYIGIQESQTRAILYDEMKHTGLTDYSALVLFGPNAALPHGSGTDRHLGADEFALIDAGGRWGGYLADITRTFYLPDSKIPEAHQWVWEIVRAAQMAPASLLRYIEPKEPAFFSWLDDRARETVKKGMAALGVPPQKGRFPDYQVFTHRTGHGIGLEGHESPYVVQGALGERQVLPGHTFTLEPGVYVPEDATVGDERVKGLGVRLEDTVVVVEKGGRLAVEWLTGPVSGWGEV